MIPFFIEKNSSTRDKIISVLAENPGISTKKICAILKKQYALNVTYQAVHKTLKQMVEQRIITFSQKKYVLDERWINNLKLFLLKITNKNNLSNKIQIDYNSILNFESLETTTFVLNTRQEFDDFYFKIREKLIDKLEELPVEKRKIFHHIGNLYISLTYPTKEHNLLIKLRDVKGQGYFFCNGVGPVNKWATRLYEHSPIKIFLGQSFDSSKLVFIYPHMMIEAYYSQNNLKVFDELYDKKWGIEQIDMSTIIDKLYSVNDPIKIVITKDPVIIKSAITNSEKLLSMNMKKEVVNESIEEIITKEDIKDYNKLRKYLPKSYCMNSAKYILDNKGKVIIATGFFINGPNTIETDGIIGAILLEKTLEKLGFDVKYLTDKYCSPILKKLTEKEVITFPILSYDESLIKAKNILEKEKPSLLIAIERAGLNSDGQYTNIRKEDITEYTAKLDAFFNIFDKTISIVDTGNEIGMGNLNKELIAEKIDIIPSITKAKHIILGTTTNWGTYGLIIALSKLSKKKLIEIDEKKILQKAVDFGAVDGITKKRELSYDTFGYKQNEEIINSLNKLISNL